MTVKIKKKSWYVLIINESFSSFPLPFLSLFLNPCVLFYHRIDPANETEAEEFVQWVHFHATVCKHNNVARMLHCRTKSLPMYLVLEACNPGNLLHFLWSLRNVNS